MTSLKRYAQPKHFWIKPFLEIGIYWWRCTMKELWATSRQIAPVVVATTSAARFFPSFKYSFTLCYQLIICPVPWRNMENGISASSVNSFILCLQLLGVGVRGTQILPMEISGGGCLLADQTPPIRSSHCVHKTAGLLFQDMPIVGSAA